MDIEGSEKLLTVNASDEAKKSVDDKIEHGNRQKRGCIPGYTTPGGCAPHEQNEYLSPPNEYVHDTNIIKSYPSDLGAFLYGS